MALVGYQPLVVGVSIALTVLATASGILRLVSRWMMQSGFWWDDWCSILALILSYAFNVSQFVSVHCHMGQHGSEVPDMKAALMCTSKSLYSVIMVYTVCMPSIKATIVLLYWRLFSGKRSMRISLYIVSTMLFAWFLGALISGLFVCQPIARFWDKSIPGHCLNTEVYFRAIAGTNLATDVMLLLIPVPIIWGLHRPTSERIALIGVFALGTFVTVVSVIRIALLTSPDDPDPLWANTQGTIWTAVETSVGVICVNLPSMSPIFRRFILRYYPTSRSTNTSRYLRSNSKRSTINISQSGPSRRRAESITSSTERLGNENGASYMVPPEIVVTTDLDVTDQKYEVTELRDMQERPTSPRPAYGDLYGWEANHPSK